MPNNRFFSLAALSLGICFSHSALAGADSAAVNLARAAELAAIRAKHEQTEREVAAIMRARQEEIRRERGGSRPKASAAGETTAPPAPPVERWSYEGETGPLRWGKINPAWAKCHSGNRQSPIDIREGIQVELETINFDYRPASYNVVNNGYTVQVNFGAGNRISLTGRTYELLQFHFHHPAEETVGGRGFPMVAHLVHKDAEGRLAVVALLVESGNPNPVVQAVWNNLPLEQNEPLVPITALDMSQILPERREYYTYMGSLTTPPCSEGVLWIVMKEPIKLSPQQIAIFARLYPMNARPVQATAGRLIKESQ
ncbi:carbonic anhydrase family protein [Noviherbaspirillum sp. CPCC 100848]|uniref:carbonic anhydrase n=1 Tax=Noviherbaspirillum album TaxID=3080276 RepID=A0ABU6JFJ3_9BURK|nr:carbonic anhydrase family protein [Noviherbaspirillum sp. CPCC 100848]MEC4722295.1 carbonic anhydrase family protein [Noviherbaspirillum sp. CPCC 100848]